MTTFDFPIRISETGERLAPSGIDPYTLPWVAGASATVPYATRLKYGHALPRDERANWGPTPRTDVFKLMANRPLGEDGLPLINDDEDV